MKTRTDGATRIVHIIPRDALGGVETAARSMLKGQSSCDLHLVLVAGQLLSGRDDRVSGSPFRSELNWLAQWHAVRRILRLEPNVLVCSLWKSIPAALIAKRLRPSMKLVAFLHVDRTTHSLDDWLHSRLERRSDAIWTDSEATRRARLGHGSAKPGRTISFVLERFEPPNRESIPSARFVSWGRLNRQKGVDRALRLIAELVSRGVDVRYEAWGPDGGELLRLQELGVELRIANRVSFPGEIDRAQFAGIASSASFYLQLSRFEGMAIAVVEAKQLGLVPIVTAVGEIGNYCHKGINAVVVDPGDLQRAATDISEILSSPARYADLRTAAIDQWANSPLYSDDLCAAARELIASSTCERSA